MTEQGGRLRKAASATSNPRVQVWFNGTAMVFWFVMMVPVLLVAYFSHSILWIAFISTWSLFATHLGGWISALVNVKAERIDDRQEEVAKLSHLCELEERILAAIENRAVQ